MLRTQTTPAPLTPERPGDAKRSSDHCLAIVPMGHGNDLAIAVQEIPIATFTSDSFAGSY